MTNLDQDYLDHFNHFLEVINELDNHFQLWVLENVDNFEDMADDRNINEMTCTMPAPLALVLYQRDPQFIADWFTWREQIANG